MNRVATWAFENLVAIKRLHLRRRGRQKERLIEQYKAQLVRSPLALLSASGVLAWHYRPTRAA